MLVAFISACKHIPSDIVGYCIRAGHIAPATILPVAEVEHSDHLGYVAAGGVFGTIQQASRG